MLDLSLVIGSIVQMATDAGIGKLSRSRAVLEVMQKLSLALPDVEKFEDVYTCALVEYGVDKPEGVLNFFAHPHIQEAFRRSLYECNADILKNEAEELIRWDDETNRLGRVDYDPRMEFAAFTAVFNRIVSQGRTPAEVQRDQKLEDLLAGSDELLERMRRVPTLQELRDEIVRSFPQPAAPVVKVVNVPEPENAIRWLHLSDFHFGDDRWAQPQMCTYILENIRAHCQAGRAPDLIFITGDIANHGKTSEYRDFMRFFMEPLINFMGDSFLERIFFVPGNHDVDRDFAKAVDLRTVLSRTEYFLNPDQNGLQERSPIFKRFEAFQTELLNTDWVGSAEGVSVTTLEIKGHRLGILGINTAWLSMEKNEQGFLTPGKNMLETGLNRLNNCDLRIVLGHHPLYWFIHKEGNAIKKLLANKHALYLHGHLHEDEYETISSGETLTTVQAGAAFQGSEASPYVNRILWCALDGDHYELWAEPLQWSMNQQAWVLDGVAFAPELKYPGGDRWVLPIPAPVESREAIPPAISPAVSDHPSVYPSLKLQPGWMEISSDFLTKQNHPLDDTLAMDFFDGDIMSFRYALSPRIPRREMVETLVKEVRKQILQPQNSFILLTGAGGEGKSTVLMQTICDTALQVPQVRVLWRTAPDAAWTQLIDLPAFDGKWIIASDNADLGAKSLAEVVQNLKRQDLVLLMTARDTDWRALKLSESFWNRNLNFVEKHLAGLTETDAARIIAAWAGLPKNGLGRLNGLPVEAAQKRLLEMTQPNREYIEQGAFLGAMLSARYGEGLKSRVSNLLSRLEQRPAPGRHGTLMHAFAYIAVLHAENILILTQDVLAEALNCTRAELMQEVIFPLGEEAAISRKMGSRVLTRHREIARVAVDVLFDEHGISMEELYVDLLEAAMRVRPDDDHWTRLPNLMQSVDIDIAIQLAEILCEIEPANEVYLVTLVKLLRNNDQSGLAVKKILRSAQKVKRDRAFYMEWATCEGNLRHTTLDAWLTAVCLADDPMLGFPTRDDVMMGLAGLSACFQHLMDNYPTHSQFTRACIASTWLAVQLRPREDALDTTGTRLRRLLADLKTGSNIPANKETALEWMKAGIIQAWELSKNELPAWVRRPDTFSFHDLQAYLGLIH